MRFYFLVIFYFFSISSKANFRLDTTETNPLKLGVNIVAEAVTKYINGHSDILLGIIASDKKYSKQIRKYIKTIGICVGSEEVYLALRGLPTLELRIKQIEKIKKTINIFQNVTICSKYYFKA